MGYLLLYIQLYTILEIIFKLIVMSNILSYGAYCTHYSLDPLCDASLEAYDSYFNSMLGWC